MLLTMLMLSQIVGHCAKNDAVQTLASVAKVESGFQTLAIHDNTSGDNPQAIDQNDAARIAQELIARGHSVDLGLMQINSNNLGWLGLSVDDAFDACKSVAAGAAVLRSGYQQALRVAFSRYNTGDASRGFANGYVGKVLSASTALPAITASAAPAAEPEKPAPPPVPTVVLDMLHGGESTPNVTPGDNLLAGVVLPTPSPRQGDVAVPVRVAQAPPPAQGAPPSGPSLALN